MTMQKVIWQEGMLLRPQHFQQSDRYYDYQLKTRTRTLELYAWGFFDLEIDRQSLNTGKLVVNQASGILPDGTLFEIDREAIAIDVPPNTSNMPVYLALPLATGNHIEARRPDHDRPPAPDPRRSDAAPARRRDRHGRGHRADPGEEGPLL